MVEAERTYHVGLAILGGRAVAARGVRSGDGRLADCPRTARILRELEAVAEKRDAAIFQQWITWARHSADELDAAAQARRLNDVDFDVLVRTDDIEPYMEGRSTTGRYRAPTGNRPSTPHLSVPLRRPWHPGMREPRARCRAIADPTEASH